MIQIPCIGLCGDVSWYTGMYRNTGDSHGQEAARNYSNYLPSTDAWEFAPLL